MKGTPLNVTACRDKLAEVIGGELMALPRKKADECFHKLNAGEPKLVTTGDMVAVLFHDGTYFTSCNRAELE